MPSYKAGQARGLYPGDTTELVAPADDVTAGFTSQAVTLARAGIASPNPGIALAIQWTGTPAQVSLQESVDDVDAHYVTTASSSNATDILERSSSAAFMRVNAAAGGGALAASLYRAS